MKLRSNMKALMRLQPIAIITTAILFSAACKESKRPSTNAKKFVGGSEVSKEEEPESPTPGKASESPEPETDPRITETFSLRQNSLNEVFVEKQLPAEVSILLVIDHSFSMIDEMQKLTSELHYLIPQIKDLRWQLIITTADAQQNCYAERITYTSPDPATAFSQALTRITSNISTDFNYEERIFYSAHKALTCADKDRKWIRPWTATMILFASDEDNCVDHPVAASSGACQQSELDGSDLRNLLKKNFTNYHLQVYGLHAVPTASGAACVGFRNKVPSRYSNFMKDFTGKAYSMCENSYAPLLTEMSTILASRRKVWFRLKPNTDPDSVKVTVNTEVKELGKDYKFEDNIVKFQSGPPEVNTEVRIEYSRRAEPNKDGSFTFGLSRTPAPDSIEVTINGATLDADSYTYNEEKNSITILKVSESDEIEVAYLPSL